MTEAFYEIVQLGIADGITRVCDLPGCWERDVDGRWFFALNGHPTPTTCSKGATVPPYHAYIEFNGWPAGLVGAHGAHIAAGEAANERTFIEAVRTARGGVEPA